MFLRVNLTEVRPRLSEIMGRAEHGNTKVMILRNGKPVAALVSMKDFWRVWEAETDEIRGPKDPVTGRRKNPVVITVADCWAKYLGKLLD